MMSLRIILLVICSQLVTARNEHQMRHNRIDKSRNDAVMSMDEHYRRPYFEGEPANVSVVEGETAYLVCVVRSAGNNSISWIRHNDINLLSVGAFKYTQDPRYQIFHNAHNGTWTLKIRRVRADTDAGWYQCQIGMATSQPIGRMIYLKVIDPQLSILQGAEMFVGVGSNLNLTCYIEHAEVAVTATDDEWGSALRWSHDNEELNHHSPRGVFVSSAQLDAASISHLIIKNLSQSDAGVYKCTAPGGTFASTAVHVEGDQSMETKVSSIAHELQSAVTFTAIAAMMTLLRMPR